MDIKKFKGINWVGNIYQKFEEICHEVEDIVIQDKFKVEAQVQTVSKNVKKIYSDVQDFLPPLRGAVKHDAQDAAIKENFAITGSKENLEETFLDLIEKKSPTEPSAMDPGTNQLSLVSSIYDLAYRLDSPTSIEALEVSESDFSSGKIDEVSHYATGKQSPPPPNVMDVVTNQLSLVSSQYHIADQSSSPTSVDGFQVSEFELSVGKVHGVLTNEGLLDATTKMPYIVDPGINQLDLVSSKYRLPDQPISPTSRDTPDVSGWGLEEIDEVLATEDSLDATEKQSPLEPIVMDTEANLLSHVSSKYHLGDQRSSPTSMDSFEVPESKLSAGTIDEVLTNEIFLDATETQSPTEANVLDPVENKVSIFFSKYNLADGVSSPYSVDNLEVLESDLSVAKMDDSLTQENSDANNEQISMQVSEPILLELASPVVSEHFAAPPFGVSSHSDHENRHSVLPEDALTTPAHGPDFQSQKKLNFCNNSSDGIECVRSASNPASEMAFSVPAGENTTEKMDVAKECSPGMSSGKNPLLRPSEYSAGKLQALFSHNSVEVDGCFPVASFGVSSSASPLSESDKNKDVEKEHSSFSSVLLLNSVAEGTSRITEIMPLTVPSSKEQVEVYETVQDALKSSSDIECPDASSSDSSHSHMETIDLHDKVILEENSSHSRMGTIDLHDKVKLEESCVIVDDSMLHAISSRARKLRSYKQRIQDAFTSKKRLAKEYEQLAIWFGDTDINLSQEIPSNAKTLQTLNARDFEWELL